MKTYHKYTSSLTYSYLACLPLLALYELLIWISQPGSEAMVRLSADIWIRSLLLLFNENTLLLTIVLTVVLGAVIFYKERKKRYTLKQSYFAGMVAESVGWALLLWVLVSGVVGVVFGMSVSGEADQPGGLLLAAESGLAQGGITRLQMLALSIGAGLYEELIFRVVLVYGLLWVFTLFMKEKTAALSAVLLAAALFSAVHYTGTFGDPFTLSSFMFRMLFGLALNGLLLFRGFGITAWTHSMYDVILVMFFLQG